MNFASSSKTRTLLTSTVSMQIPNESILIQEGTFKFSYQGSDILIDGQIKLCWTPQILIWITGRVSGGYEYSKYLRDLSGEFEVFFDDLPIGRSRIVYEQISEEYTEHTYHHAIKAIMHKACLGDKSIMVDEILFEIPNFFDFNGEAVHDVDEKVYPSTRFILTDEKYEIIIDKVKDFSSLSSNLKDIGGYVLNAVGCIKRIGGNITLSELVNMKDAFSLFLTFLKGRRISWVIAKAYYEGECVWQYYDTSYVDNYKSVLTWLPHHLNNQEHLWMQFLKLYSKDQFAIRVAIHWYVEANANSAFAEGSVVLIQNAHELLYNWLMIETFKIVKGEDGKNIAAANKLRILLSKLEVDTSIPNTLTALLLIDSSFDGPDAFCQIRNAIVHANDEKRKKLISLPPGAVFEALQLGIRYVEFTLLFMLNHEGLYNDRCLLVEKPVPWKHRKPHFLVE
jgi:hypothetical protein